jgi:AGZA family xanthine/uracil permease-like MFS transporter
LSFEAFTNFYNLNKIKGASLKKEIIAGITSFIAISYLFFLIPKIIVDAGIDPNAAFTSIILASIFGTLFMSVFAKKPFALAPSLALTTFFTYSIVRSNGVAWQTALGALFFAGVLYMILSISKLRDQILNAIPLTIKKGICTGIGLFLVMVGLRISGILVSNNNSFLYLGNLLEPTALLTFLGILILIILISKKNKLAYIWSSLIIAFLSWIIGNTTFGGSFLTIPDVIIPTILNLDFIGAFGFPQLIFSFLIILFLTTTSNIIALSSDPNKQNKMEVKGMKKLLISDSMGTMIGNLFGVPFVTTRMEGMSGIQSGGKTGITSLVVALLLIALFFFSPLLSLIPLAAVSSILIVSGISMVPLIKGFKKKDPSNNIPAYLTAILIPFSFSIPKGIALGFIIYTLVKLFSGKSKELTITTYVLSLIFLFFLVTN